MNTSRAITESQQNRPKQHNVRIDGIMQKIYNSIVNALESRPFWLSGRYVLGYTIYIGMLPCIQYIPRIIPDGKVHGANMGPIWGRQDPGGPHVGPMTFAICDTVHALFRFAMVYYSLRCTPWIWSVVCFVFVCLRNGSVWIYVIHAPSFFKSLVLWQQYDHPSTSEVDDHTMPL